MHKAGGISLLLRRLLEGGFLNPECVTDHRPHASARK